ncbi:hypothetical protein SAMN05421848_0898 [Kushneria avicenniae]|uniref:Uncharacterized protein n=1 Tax=Kushneria avicenniae TaxID=402385 RepID=A0A1I1I5F0_9GAMM|nr:hypothetical protein SAMN05421848_0898 [Kushneria avicenniae]
MLQSMFNDTLTPPAPKAAAAFLCVLSMSGYPVGYWFRDRHA